MAARDVTDDSAARVLDAIDHLIGDLTSAVPPLRAIAQGLGTLADGLAVERVIVAVDDPALGRQVFCSDRRPLGEAGTGLFGPTGTWTEPPRALDADAARLLDRAIAVALARADAAVPATAAVEHPAAPDLAPAMGLAGTVTAATARALRHGWGFTLVLLHGGAGLTEALRPRVRAADTLVATSDRELALLLPETAGDLVPAVLARLAAGRGVPPFSYGLACCPADSRDATVLARIATERLAEAVRARALG
jgi:hypothetical protein